MHPFVYIVFALVVVALIVLSCESPRPVTEWSRFSRFNG